MAAKSSSSIWKWLAGGCGCLVILAIGAGIALWNTWPTIRDGISRSMQENDVYAEALERVRADARVTAALGTPIDGGLPEQFQIHTGTAGTVTNLAVPLSGPNATGRMEVEARGNKETGIVFEKLVVWVGGQGYDLLVE